MKCPYCNSELFLSDFFSNVRKGFLSRELKGIFKGLEINKVKIFICPHCDKILGFSENSVCKY